MKKILVFLVLALAVFSKDEVGVGYFSGGYQKQDMSEISTALNNNGYGTIEDDFYSFGGGGYGQIGKILIGGEGYAMSKLASNSGTNETVFSTGYGFFNLGYVLNSSKHFKIYPALGIGGYGSTINIKESGSNFDNILDGSKKNISLSHGGMLLQGTLGFDYLIDLNKTDSVSRGILIGLRLGYIFSPSQNVWNDDLTGPDFALKGPYAKVVIGGGTF